MTTPDQTPEPALSVVTPSFNQGRFIGRTAASVLGQGVDVEYVVMDGGSCDGTAEALRPFAGRLTFISEHDRGQTDALNKGIATTRGEIIGWVNSDDVHYPGAYRAVLAHFAAHPECDVVYGRADHIDEYDAYIEDYPTEAFDLNALTERCFFCQPAVFFRRRVVARWGLPDAALRYSMDYEYWLRLGLAGARFDYLPVKLAGSRLYADTKTLGQRVQAHAEINSMLRDALGRTPDKWLCNFAHALLADRLGLARQGRFFAPLAAAATLASSLWWNRRISAGLWRTVRAWLGT